MRLLAAAAIAIGFTLNASAADNDFIVGSATIVQAVSVTNQSPLNFGSVSQGINKTVTLAGTATGDAGQTALGTETTGRFLLSAAPGTNVTMTFTTPPNLLNVAVPLLIEDWAYGWEGTNIEPTNLFSTGDPNGTTNFTTFPTNVAEGTINGVYVFIGGTVKPLPAQAVGTYTANITLTATYN